MAERAVEVVALDGDRVQLRALGACSDCAGCGGRCNLFQGLDPARETLQLARAQFPCAPLAGEHWRLLLDDDQLLRQASRGYGLALAGLIGGAGLGYGAARFIGIAPDLLTLLAAVAGTSLGILRSKRGPAAALRLLRMPSEP